MATRYVPTRQDAERYRILRNASRALSDRLVATIPSRAYEEIGNALGIRRNGVLVFDTEDMAGVLADCCLFEWYQGGRNLVQQYAEAHPPKLETDAGFLLNAYLQAKYRILVSTSAVPDAGIYCYDAQTREEFFLMDFAFSRSLGNGTVALAGRTVPLGGYWMTTGAALPITSPEDVQTAMRETDLEDMDALEGPGQNVLFMVRACLAAGAAKHIVYEGSGGPGPGGMFGRARREPRFPGFKRRRRLH